MKTILLLALLFCYTTSKAQDSIKIKQIDSLVSVITHSNWPVQQDSVIQDYPSIGLSMKTYITVLRYAKELKKYAQVVKSTRKEGEVTMQDLSGSAFYYDQDKLVKVEEFFVHEGKENKMGWYYADDKCIYHSLQSAKAADRAIFLVDLANTFLKKMANPSGGIIPR